MHAARAIFLLSVACSSAEEPPSDAPREASADASLEGDPPAPPPRDARVLDIYPFPKKFPDACYFPCTPEPDAE